MPVCRRPRELVRWATELAVGCSDDVAIDTLLGQASGSSDLLRRAYADRLGDLLPAGDGPFTPEDRALDLLGATAARGS